MIEIEIEIQGKTYPKGSLTLPAEKAFMGAWTKPDGENVVHVDWDAARKDFRAKAKLPKAVFLRKIAEAGILPKSEALEAAKGNWPATFATALSALPESKQFEAQINWAAATFISRNDPLLELLRSDAGVAPETLDAMFGYSGE